MYYFHAVQLWGEVPLVTEAVIGVTAENFDEVYAQVYPARKSVDEVYSLIISDLEGAARGAYCGTLGYMNFDGSGQWNVLIRTLQANTLSNDELEQERRVSLWAGGGITVASDCNAEYQECLDKVGNLLGVLAKNNIKQ